MTLLYVSIWRTGSKKQKERACTSLSNGAGILDIDVRGNTRCNPSEGDDHESAEGMQAGVWC